MLIHKEQVPTGSSITTIREPRDEHPETTTSPLATKRSYRPPDAAMPGPLARHYPIEEDPDASAGGDSFYDGIDGQNQDRI